MSLVITKESVTVYDERKPVKALKFTIERRIGLHSDCAARFVIPEDPSRLQWLHDVYVSSQQLHFLLVDLKTDTDFNWLTRPKEESFRKLLWNICEKIIYGADFAGDGFQFLSDDQVHPIESRSLDAEAQEATRRKAIAILQVRNPEDIHSDIVELRKQLFQNQKRWLVLS